MKPPKITKRTSTSVQFLHWHTLQGQAPQPKQRPSQQSLRSMRSRSSLNAGNEQMYKCLPVFPACLQWRWSIANLFKPQQRVQKRNHQPQRYTEHSGLGLLIYLCDQVIPHDFTRHVFLCCLQTNHGRNHQNQTMVGFRCFLKATWALEFKDKVRAKSIPILAFAGFCRRFQSNESVDKCTATLDTIL